MPFLKHQIKHQTAATATSSVADNKQTDIKMTLEEAVGQGIIIHFNALMQAPTQRANLTYQENYVFGKKRKFDNTKISLQTYRELGRFFLNVNIGDENCLVFPDNIVTDLLRAISEEHTPEYLAGQKAVLDEMQAEGVPITT